MEGPGSVLPAVPPLASLGGEVSGLNDNLSTMVIADDGVGDAFRNVDSSGENAGVTATSRLSGVVSSPPPLSSQKDQILNLLSDDPLYTSSKVSPAVPASGAAVLFPGRWMRRWLDSVKFQQGEKGVHIYGWEVTKEEFEEGKVESGSDTDKDNKVPPIDYALVAGAYNMIMFYDFFPVSRSVYKAFSSWYSSSPCPAPFLLRRWEGGRLVLYPNINFGATGEDVDEYGSEGGVFSCDCCGVTGAAVGKVCSACNSSTYCSKTCQSVHWKWHSKQCGGLHRSVISGLTNLGNTCYANSAVQCLFHANPLSRLFLSNSHLEHINKSNVMSTGGKIASAFGELVKSLKFSSSDYISPVQFKRTLGACFEQFRGFGQHDAHELLTFLLDGLHEDLNNGDKRYIEYTDLDGGKLAPIVGAINHDKWLIRNKSPLSLLFFGQTQLTNICPECKNVWANFDAFSTSVLKFPVGSVKKLQVLFFKRVPSLKPLQKPVAVLVTVKKKGVVADVMNEIAKLAGVKRIGNLQMCEIYENYFYKTLRPNQPVERILETDILTCYEAAPDDDPDFIRALVTVTNGNDAHVGFPVFTCVPVSSTLKELKTHLFSLYQKNFGSDFPSRHPFHDLTDEEIATMGGEAVVVEMYGSFNNLRKRIRPTEVPWDDKVYTDVVSDEYVVHCSFFNLSLVRDLDDMFDENEAEAFIKHESLLKEERNGHPKRNETLSLDSMLRAAQKPQRLDEDNALYCRKCKTQRRVMQTQKIRKLPNILIFALSRFDFHNQHRTSRVDDLVDFPLSGLDMGKHCMANNETEVGLGGGPSEVPALYDLFGVVNHFGRAGCGHYTAICRDWAASPATGAQGKMGEQFYEFDDGAVSPRREDEVVSPQAYCLFYRRRFFT